MSASRQFYPYIDYAAHPAFRGNDVAPRANENEIDDLVVRIDEGLAQLHKSSCRDDELPGAFERGHEKYIASLERAALQSSRTERMSDWLRRAFGHARHELLVEARIAAMKCRQQDQWATNDQALRIAEKLQSDGMYACHLDLETRSKLRRLCKPHMDLLRERAKQMRIERIVYNFELFSEVGQTLHRFFKNHRILDGLRGYVGSNVNFAGFSLEFSHDKQIWYRDVYPDTGMPDSKTAYMHYDQGHRDPKAIVALSDVSEDSGPTGYVKGSHRAERSGFLHVLVKSLDHCFQLDPAQSDNAVWYRERFTRKYYRGEFLHLPKSFQSCSHFGDDILDESPLSQELLGREVKLTKDVGNCIVFDGNYGIHRGAMVRNGERFVFQVVFDIDRPLPLPTWMFRRSRGIALRMLGKGN